jgi:hypothetical protein
MPLIGALLWGVIRAVVVLMCFALVLLFVAPSLCRFVASHLPIPPLDQELLDAVGRLLVGDDVAGEEGHVASEGVAVAFGEVGHQGGIDDALLVHPFEYLRGSEGGHGALGAPRLQRGEIELEDVMLWVTHG